MIEYFKIEEISSLFVNTADLFSKIIFVQLLYGVLFMACSIFQLELVTSHIIFRITTVNSKYFILGCKKNRLPVYWINLCNRCKYFKLVLVLLFRQTHHRKLSQLCRFHLRIELVWFAEWFEEILHHDDSQCSIATPVSWIKYGRFEFGNIHESKSWNPLPK